MHVQALITHCPVESLLLSILPGLAWFNGERLHAALSQPDLHCCRHELRTVIATQIPRCPVLRHERCQHAQYALG
jgi:hypothetical protein